MSTLLQFTANAGAWDTHNWVSTEALTTDGHYAEFSVTSLDNGHGFGVTPDTSGVSTNAWVVWFSGGIVYILLAGVVQASYPAMTYKLFDRFRFRKSGSNVIVSQNGVDFHTIALAGTLYAYAASYNGTSSCDVDSVNGAAVTTRTSTACTVTIGVPSTDYFANNAALRYSPLNWIGTGTNRESSLPGASLRFSTTCAASGRASIIFDASGQVNLTQDIRTWLAYRVDGGAWTRHKLTNETLVSLELANGLSAGTHTFEVVIAESNYGGRYNASPVRYAGIFSYGVRLPTGQTLNAPLQKSRLLKMYGDSNDEGAENIYPNHNQPTSFSQLIADGIGAELSNTSFPGQGWITTPGASIPTFQNAWDKLNDTSSILSGGKITPEPKVIAIVHGQNDSTDVTAAATSTINAILAATTTAKIVVMCPVGRSRRSELIAAVAAVNNPRCVFFDNPTDWLATYGANGLNTHLTEAGHVQYANVMIPKFRALFPVHSAPTPVRQVSQTALRSTLR